MILGVLIQEQVITWLVIIGAKHYTYYEAIMLGNGSTVPMNYFESGNLKVGDKDFMQRNMLLMS